MKFKPNSQVKSKAKFYLGSLSTAVILTSNSHAFNFCTVKNLTNNCATFKNLKGNETLVFASGWTMPASAIRSNSFKNNIEYEISNINEREQILFKGAKECVIKSVILKGRTLSKLSSFELNLYKRINSVRLQNDFKKYVGPASPTYSAEYNYVTNIADFPSGMLFLPPAAILRALSHEFGHSIDPCRVTQARHEPVSPLDSNPINNYYRSKMLDKALSIDNTPYSKTLSCVINEPGGVFKGTGLQGSVGICNEPQQNEAFADWVASQALAENERSGCFNKYTQQLLPPAETKISKENNAHAQSEKVILPPGIEPFIDDLNYACDQPPRSVNDKFETHPRMEDRLEKIFFRNPRIRDSLQCHPLDQEISCKM